MYMYSLQSDGYMHINERSLESKHCSEIQCQGVSEKAHLCYHRLPIFTAVFRFDFSHFAGVV